MRQNTTTYDYSPLDSNGVIGFSNHITMPQPTILETPRPTINEMALHARARLRVSIEANAEYARLQFLKGCDDPGLSLAL